MFEFCCLLICSVKLQLADFGGIVVRFGFHDRTIQLWKILVWFEYNFVLAYKPSNDLNITSSKCDLTIYNKRIVSFENM